MQRKPLFVFGSVVFSRAIYALCWFNLSAAFPVMSAHFHYSVQALSLLTASFLLGAGIFQIPSGVISAAKGAGKTTLFALLGIAIVSTASSLSGDLTFQLIMRFLTGVGAAFYFAPAMAVASRSIGKSRSGFAIGIYNGAFNVGAASAFILFTPISALIDWRLPFIITGALSFIALFENIFAFRGLTFQTSSNLSKVRRILLSRDLLLLTCAMLGINAAYYVGTQFSVSFAENYLQFSPVLAGIISSLILFGAVVGGPLGGWLSDRTRNRRIFLILTGIIVSVAVSLFAIRNSVLIWFAAFIFGVSFSMSYSNSYAFSTEIEGTDVEYAPLAIAFLNGSGMADGSLAAPLFALAIVSAGYSYAWLGLALVTIVFGPLVFLAREPERVLHASS